MVSFYSKQDFYDRGGRQPVQKRAMIRRHSAGTPFKALYGRDSSV